MSTTQVLIGRLEDASNVNHDRIETLDFLRGIAILGMLVANIPWHVGNSMSRVFDPDYSSVSAWLLQYLVFDQRFMPIFCFLFGASYCILLNNSPSFQAFRIRYLKRMLVLLAIGVAHAYLLWPGDILITYAVCGPLLLLFHRCSIVQLITWGVIFKLVDLIFGEWPSAYSSTIEAALFSWWVDYGEAPSSAADAYAGSYSDLFAYNTWRNQFLQWTALPYFRIWNALGLMLIGMALFRMEILQGKRTAEFYRKMLKVSLLVGVPLIVYGVIARVGINTSVGPWFGFTDKLPLYNITFRTGCTVLSFSILAIIHLYWHGITSGVRVLIENVGRMALSYYLLQSLMFILVFHSLNLIAFDSIDHDVMFGLVLAMWFIHLAVSGWWLAKFKQGPVEGVYRVLSQKL